LSTKLLNDNWIIIIKIIFQIKLKMNKNDNNKRNKICKSIILLGSSGTGKTNIIKRYSKNRFEENHIVTIGMIKILN